MPNNTPEYHRAYYLANAEHLKRKAAERYATSPARQRERERLRRQRIRDFLDDLKATTPCADCGVFYPPCVMDFDHLDGHEKIANIAAVARIWSVKRLKTEIAKCEIVCSNCHRQRTFKRRRELVIFKPEEIVPDIDLQTSADQ